MAIASVSVRVAITGTDTGVGKTMVAAALAASLTQRGVRVGVFKPVETGVLPGGRPQDATRLAAAAGQLDPIDVVCPYVFVDPVAPLVASERAGRPVVVSRLDDAFHRVAAGRGAAIVEGAGGWLVPFTKALTFEQLCVRWQLDVIVVAANRLGAINHVALTIRAAEAAGLRVTGVVLNAIQPEPRDLAELTNHRAIGAQFPQYPIVSFPYLHQPDHIPTLVDAARACELLSVIRNLVT